MTAHRVLFVDDEPHVLSAIRRSLRSDFDVETATSAAEALMFLKQGPAFSVVVSDCRMPEMDGVRLLEKVATLAPDSTRIMLTGNLDQETAVRAVNRGEVFRFLNKPCDPDELKHVLTMAVRQYELVTAEKELLNRTLKGSIKVLADLLSLVKPDAFGRTSRLRRKAGQVADLLENVGRWELDTAALLCQLGCVGVEQSTLDKLQNGEPLTANEGSEFAAHPSLAAELIGSIPRMEQVAKIIFYQNKHFDGGNYPADDVRGSDIPLESRILHAVLAHDELAARGWSDDVILEELRQHPNRFDPDVLDALAQSADLSESRKTIRVKPGELVIGMVVQEDVKNQQGAMLICRGQEVTAAIREHMIKFERVGAVTKPILVSVPTPSASALARSAQAAG